MTQEAEDARFEDAAARPLRLIARSVEDLGVMGALTQDAAGKAADAAFLRRKRRFVALFNRYRWEEGAAFERVRAALSVENAQAVRARGLAKDAPDQVYNLLALRFEPGADTEGVLRLILSGDAEIAITVEALEITLTDISRPWPAQAAPRHEPDA